MGFQLENGSIAAKSTETRDFEQAGRVKKVPHDAWS